MPDEARDSDVDVNAPIPGPSENPGDPGYVVPRAAGDSAEYPSPASWRWDVPAAVNPPGYQEEPPGDTRDQNWRDYLNGKNADGGQRSSGQIPAAYPHTESVADHHLKIVGSAATQQGIRYCWGGGNRNDATQGVHDGDEADRRHDYLHKGFDCSGLVEYAVYQATGYDPAKGSWIQLANMTHGTTPFADEIGSSARGRIIVPALRPGDIIFYGTDQAHQGSQHVVIFAGNGITVETNHSGTPAHFQPVSINDGRFATVLRPR